MPITTPSKTSKTLSKTSDYSESAQNPTDKTSKTLAEAHEFGLVATWSMEFGYVSIHDPTTGEWHDVPTKEAPDWAKREAFKRKELYRSGNRRAYRLASREMEEILEIERAPEPEGIVEDHPIEEED